MQLIRRFGSFVLVCALVLAVTSGTTMAQAAHWQSDNGGWSGSGAAFLPGGTFVGGSDSGASDCPGCSWQVTPVCDLTGAHNCQNDFGCPAGQRFALIKVTDPALGMTVTVGSECMRPGDPITVEELGEVVRERVRESAPALAPGFAPGGETLTMLPTIFWSGQVGSVHRQDSIAGLSVTMQATAHWFWRWGDNGAALSTAKPGGPWPDRSVSHVYRRAGMANASVTTSWDAIFWVNGIGPFAATGDPVRQTESIPVRIRQARAVLVG